MRLAPLIAAMLVLSACNREPEFEERYSEAEATIQQQAQSIEADLRADTAAGGEATSSDLEASPVAATPTR